MSTKRMNPAFVRKYIIGCIQYAKIENFSEEHDISIDHLKAFMDPQRKLLPGPRLMKATGVRKIEDRVYVVGRERK